MSGEPVLPPVPRPNSSSNRSTSTPGAREAALGAKCLLALVAMRLGLSTIGYAAIARRLPRPQGRIDSHFWGRQVARRIERLARFVPGASCLTQALALKFVLGRAGHASQIQIGVKQDGEGAFSAHAWVTCNGRIVLGQRGTRLADFNRLAELG